MSMVANTAISRISEKIISVKLSNGYTIKVYVTITTNIDIEAISPTIDGFLTFHPNIFSPPHHVLYSV